VNLDQWMEVARAVRARGGTITPTTIREAALDTGLAAELLAEQAATLSRLGQALDQVMLRLAALRVEHEAGQGDLARLIDADREARAELLRLRWELTVVKEAMGLRGIRAELDRYWPVPRRIR
jgi:septation ring formation regulator EzrA